MLGDSCFNLNYTGDGCSSKWCEDKWW